VRAYRQQGTGELQLKLNWFRDAFCTLFLMVALWNLAHHIFNLNADGWQEAALTVSLDK
jgi:hypothetical protein